MTTVNIGPPGLIVPADNMKSAINTAWEHGGRTSNHASISPRQKPSASRGVALDCNKVFLAMTGRLAALPPTNIKLNQFDRHAGVSVVATVEVISKQNFQLAARLRGNDEIE